MTRIGCVLTIGDESYESSIMTHEDRRHNEVRAKALAGSLERTLYKLMGLKGYEDGRRS